MKRVLLIAAAVLMCAAANGQVAFKLDKKVLLDAITRSDADIANPKRNTRAQTWLDRGEAMFAASGFMLTKIYPGQPEKEMLLALGKNTPTNTELGGRAYQMYSYPYADVYLIEGVVQFWVMKETVYDGAIALGVEAYEKAAELDPKTAEKARTGITHFADVISVEANAQYNLGNTERAAELYWQGFNIKKGPVVNTIDSISVFNAGNIYLFDNKYDKAIEILTAAIENNVWEKGKTPYLLTYALLRAERYDEAKKVLDKALELFPDNKELIESMVNYYAITESDFAEIRPILEKTLTRDKENQVAWNGLAQIYLKEGDYDKSIEFFEKYVAQFPDAAQSNYYLGDAWYGKGNSIIDAMQADKTMSLAAKKAADAEAKEAFQNAWTALKKSYDADPSEVATVQRLLYSTIRLSDDPEMDKLSKQLEEEYKAMRGEE